VTADEVGPPPTQDERLAARLQAKSSPTPNLPLFDEMATGEERAKTERRSFPNLDRSTQFDVPNHNGSL
jgi:hypothetical protein